MKCSAKKCQAVSVQSGIISTPHTSVEVNFCKFHVMRANITASTSYGVEVNLSPEGKDNSC